MSASQEPTLFATKQDIQDLLSKIDDKFQSSKNSFNERFNSLENKFDTKFNNLETRMNSIEIKLETRMNFIENKFDTKLNKIEEMLIKVSARVKIMWISSGLILGGIAWIINTAVR